MATASLLNMSPTPQGVAGNSPARMAISQGSGSSGVSTGTAGITASDFLTLLVTEMKNQDPTANRDPNEYINQLVQVNSLQQLIGIHDVLTSALGTSTTPSNEATDSTGARKIASEALPAVATKSTQEALPPFAFGNLAAPEPSPSADVIAQALAGRTGNIEPSSLTPR